VGSHTLISPARTVAATAIAFAIGALVALCPTQAATASPPANSAASDVSALERATVDLARAKRAASSSVERLRRDGAGTLDRCMRGGPGWKRIRKVRHRPQRELYARAARTLLRDMESLLHDQRAPITAYRPVFDRFMAGIQGVGAGDPLLREAVAAHARRNAAHQEIGRIEVGCRVFNRLTAKVREFPTRTPEQIIRVDYKAPPIAGRIERHISKQVVAAERRSRVSDRDAETLERAAGLMIGHGANPGYATAFRYALSLR
jgi:hypothetical protein